MPTKPPLQKLLGSRLPLWGLVLLALVLVFHRSRTREIEPDEIEAMHSGWLMLAGERPYADFVQQHHPLHYVLLAGVFALAGEGGGAVMACRALHFGLFLASLGMVWLLAVELWEPPRGAQVGLYALVLLCTSAVFANKVIDVRPDVPMVLTGLVAIWAFLRHGRDRRLRFLVLGSLALGLSFLFLQKALFLMLALLALSALRLLQGRMSWRELGVCCAALAAVLLPFYGWLAAKGDLAAYYLSNWVVNADGEGGFGPAFWLVKNVSYSTVLWIFFALGTLFCLEQRRERELAFVTLVLLASLWVMQRPWPYYTLPMLPLMAVIAGRALAEVFGERTYLAHAVLLLGAVPGLYFLEFTPYQHNAHRLAMIELARSQTLPGERVHDGDCQFNVFRKPLGYYWYSLGEDGVMERCEKVSPRGYDRDQLFNEHQPRVVSTAELQHLDPRIAARYRPSSLDPAISLLAERHAAAGSPPDSPALHPRAP